MATDRLEQVRAFLPEDGTDLAVAFGPAWSVSSGGLVAGDARVRMVARDGALEAQGPDAFQKTWADWLEPWESYRVFHEDLVERDDEVIWLVRLRGVTKRGGVELEQEGAAAFRFEADRVTEVIFSLDRAQLGV